MFDLNGPAIHRFCITHSKLALILHFINGIELLLSLSLSVLCCSLPLFSLSLICVTCISFLTKSHCVFSIERCFSCACFFSLCNTETWLRSLLFSAFVRIEKGICCAISIGQNDDEQKQKKNCRVTRGLNGLFAALSSTSFNVSFFRFCYVNIAALITRNCFSKIQLKPMAFKFCELEDDERRRMKTAARHTIRLIDFLSKIYSLLHPELFFVLFVSVHHIAPLRCKSSHLCMATIFMIIPRKLIQSRITHHWQWNGFDIFTQFYGLCLWLTTARSQVPLMRSFHIRLTNFYLLCINFRRPHEVAALC